ncbi:MAG TPA: 1,4-dihydroxy-2-naphthoate octaprenyltransferase [Rhodoblastus sp.]|nr:1,4-dihydroxy-2-naphthoate octaprenyltransferase [Rhodoblastus sp.]
MNAAASLSPIGIWIHGARPQTLVLSLTPIIVGVAYSFAVFHHVDIVPVLAATLSAVAIQIATNLANDSADGGRGADGAERLGPLRLVGAGLMSAARVRRGALVATLVAALAGLVVVAYGGAPILAVGVASLIAAWSYSYGPAPISASPLGEVFVILFFGVAATAGIVWLAVGAIDATALLLGVALGLPAAAVLTVNNHRDRAQDATSGRRTLAILLGARRTAFLYTAELAAATLLAGAALWPLSRAAGVIAAGGLAVALVRGHFLAQTPISRAMNRQLSATVRFQIGLALAIVGLLLSLPR